MPLTLAGPEAGTTAMPNGLNNPEIREAFTVAPEVVYWPTVWLLSQVTYRSDPETAMPNGSFNPVIRAALSVAPEVVYWPIAPLLLFTTNRSDPETATPSG